MIERVDCVVIGAGVVGLACARALALAGREVLILEAAPHFGAGASSRNSEVVHAGLYYPPGSLKARLCVRGRDLLYAYCDARGVAQRRCGKLVVATCDAQRGRLGEIARAAHANGVGDVRLIESVDARALEPELNCVAALHSPSTGIVDSHGLMLALLGDAENAGAMLALKTPVLDGRVLDDGLQLNTGGEAPMSVAARTVINAAGLFAPLLASRLQGLPPAWVAPARFAKGSYFSLRGRTPFSRLIYPVPEPGGLGVHLTLDLQGRARFGPDVEWLDPAIVAAHDFSQPEPFDYRVDPARLRGFDDAIRRYWPALPDDALAPDYAGIRAKIVGPDDAPADFRIDARTEHGITGLINLFGIESPGLTSCLAIAEEVLRVSDSR